MCIICVEYQQNKLTLVEAYNNLREMRSNISDEHFVEIYDKLNEDFYNNVISDDESNLDEKIINETFEAYANASASCAVDFSSINPEKIVEEWFEEFFDIEFYGELS